MASIRKQEAGTWRVQVRRKGRSVSENFVRYEDAKRWAVDAERQIDRGENPTVSRVGKLKTFGELIDLHISDMKEVGKAPGRSKSATLKMLKHELGDLYMVEVDRARMNLWLNPRICAATDASDLDLRDLRQRRMSLYLCVSPDNLARVAPLYSLLLQQLVDLNTRERPTGGHNDVPALVLLDEFARLGHATVIAHGFSYVAGYGLRLLPVLQSPAQLRAEYGADLAEEIMANCGVEIAFAPKELKVAQDLSERLGTWTYAGRTKSRPALLSSGHWSTTESDQRRPLMLPQELIQMPANWLIVLKAGMPPVRGDKIVY